MDNADITMINEGFHEPGTWLNSPDSNDDGELPW